MKDKTKSNTVGAWIFNLGKFRAIGRVPRGTPCYSTENAEIFYHTVGAFESRVQCRMMHAKAE